MNMNHSTNIASDTTLPVLTVKDGHPVTTSLDVAKVFGKQHGHVIRAIQRLECSDDFRLSNFGESSYLNAQNKQQPVYHITRDGFSFLAMGFTGSQAAKWKETYIAAFNAMEAELLKQKTQSTTEVMAIALAKMAEQEREVSRIRQEHENLKAVTHKMQEHLEHITQQQAEMNDDTDYMTV